VLSLVITVTYFGRGQAAEANRLFSIFAKRVARFLRVKVHWKGEAVSSYRCWKASSRCSSSLRDLKSLGVRTPLNNREVNLNLIEPASVDGGVHENHVGPLRAEAVDRPLAAMGGAVVHDPENAPCGLVGLSAHDFPNQAIDRSNAGFLFAAAWILLFSSAEMTNSRALRARPCQTRSYRSRMRPALAAKSGSRGKIQPRCRQGRRASALSQRHKVAPLISATNLV